MTDIEKLLEERRLPSLMNKSADEIRSCLRLEYGSTLPEAESVEFETVSVREKALAGKATHTVINAVISRGGRSASFPVNIMVPVGEGKFPTVVMANFRPCVPDLYLPSEEICDMGVAVASFCYEDVSGDNGDFGDAFSLLFGVERSEPYAPGKLMLWARACSCVADYLESTGWADMKNLAVAGHSRLGKTALLAGALDERFSFVYSNDSGCGGAALYRGKQGEDVESITRVFPHWFCPSFREYAGREQELPHDRHLHLALIAPRRVYVASAEEDLWADPLSEFLCCVAASPAWEALGLEGITADAVPSAPAHFHSGSVAYHVRKGTHFLSREDWHLFLTYMLSRLNK